MITLETVVAFALRDPAVMDQLGPALRNDLVLANPFYRRVVEFADEFLLQRRKLPGDGDWIVWLEGLPEGMLRDGTKEALGRLWAVDTRLRYAPMKRFSSTVISLKRCFPSGASVIPRSTFR